ncbi:AMP-binding protein [Micromonospora sp. FIMYZ51]|uniref:AMP-binding protein n=1 Tax=Micromonospora sp. FIMYZ51 TaxID=3051832 RepID=UPI00311F6791
MAGTGVLRWLDEPSAGRGIRFSAPDGTWRHLGYPELAESSRRAAAALHEVGVRPGDTVAMVSAGGPDFVGVLFGALLLGAYPAPLAPPQRLAGTDGYADRLCATVDSIAPTVVVPDPAHRTVVAAALAVGDPVAAGQAAPASAGCAGVAAGSAGVARTRPVCRDSAELVGHATVWDRPPAAGGGLVQTTSGSGGTRKAVRIPLDALAANIAAIRSWLGMSGATATASWLPVHHDMGLIGCLLTPIVDGSDLTLMTPGEFVHRPLRYLALFSGDGAAHTAMPAFGLAHLLRRVGDEQLAALDLTGWRSLIVGAERVDAELLTAFAGRLRRCGFDPRALLPAYGLAEATLAVTGARVTATWSSVRVDAASVAPGRAVRLTDDADGLPVVGCGGPLDAVTVTIVDAEGRPVPVGQVGEIVVQSPGLAAGYLTAAGELSADAGTTGGTRFQAGRLHTADAGFLHQGQLYVLGRLGDSLKVRGRTVFAEDVEAALVAGGVPRHRLAALLGARDGVPSAVVVLEQPERAWVEVAQRELRRLADGARSTVISARPRTIARTSSGKPRRRELWDLLITNRLGRETT